MEVSSPKVMGGGRAQQFLEGFFQQAKSGEQKLDARMGGGTFRGTPRKRKSSVNGDDVMT